MARKKYCARADGIFIAADEAALDRMLTTGVDSCQNRRHRHPILRLFALEHDLAELGRA